MNKKMLQAIVFAIVVVVIAATTAQPAVELLAPLDAAQITEYPIQISFNLKKPGVYSVVSINGFPMMTLNETLTEASAVASIPFLINGQYLLRVEVLSRKTMKPLGHHAEATITVNVPWTKPEPDPPLEQNKDEFGNEIEVEQVGSHVIMHQPMNFVHWETIVDCGGEGWVPRTNKIRVFDAFMFFNELDVLEVRLNELDPYVDVFVLCEATKTHQGDDKPLYYLENIDRFEKFRHKIRHLVVDDLFVKTDSWSIENNHRNKLTRALFDVGPEDLVIISDVDEIPRPEVIHEFVHCDGYGTPAFLYSRFFNFRFEYEFAGSWTHGPRVARGKDLEPLGWYTPQDVRTLRMRWKHTKLEEAGWHISFFADADGILKKMDAFAHAEFRNEKWKNKQKIQEALDKGIDYFNDKDEPRVGGLLKNMACEGLPNYVMQNPEKFAAWIPHCRAMEEKLNSS